MVPLGAQGDEADLALLRRYAGGDAAAFERLLERHGATTYAFIRRFLGGAPATDDVYQEVWLRVIRGAPRFEGRSRFTTWLFQVTRSACMDHLRAQGRRRDRASLDEAAPGEQGTLGQRLLDRGPGAGEAAERRELKHAVETAVASLPPDQREVFLLRETTPLSFSEIARLLGESPNTIKSRMRYALEHVRRRLGALVPARREEG